MTEEEPQHNYLIDIAKKDLNRGHFDSADTLARICIAEELEKIRIVLEKFLKGGKNE